MTATTMTGPRVPTTHALITPTTPTSCAAHAPITHAGPAGPAAPAFAASTRTGLVTSTRTGLTTAVRFIGHFASALVGVAVLGRELEH